MKASMNGLMGRRPDEPAEKPGDALKLLEESVEGGELGPSRNDAKEDAKDWVAAWRGEMFAALADGRRVRFLDCGDKAEPGGGATRSSPSNVRRGERPSWCEAYMLTKESRPDRLLLLLIAALGVGDARDTTVKSPSGCLPVMDGRRTIGDLPSRRGAGNETTESASESERGESDWDRAVYR